MIYHPVFFKYNDFDSTHNVNFEIDLTNGR